MDEIETAVGGDPAEIDWTALETRREAHPIIADAAKTAQFLANKGEVLTPAAMALFLDGVLSEFVQTTNLLNRKANGDYSEDQHLKMFPEYRRKARASVAPRSGKAVTAMQLFKGYIVAKQLADGSVRQWRPVFAMLDAYLAGRDFDALSDDEAQRWVTGLVAEAKGRTGRSAGTVR